MGLCSAGGGHPHHVYVTDGTWAFDHDGWTSEAELLATTRAAEPQVGYARRLVEPDLALLCARHAHRRRDQFAFDPWPRALRYLRRFPPPLCPPG